MNPLSKVYAFYRKQDGLNIFNFFPAKGMSKALKSVSSYTVSFALSNRVQIDEKRFAGQISN